MMEQLENEQIAYEFKVPYTQKHWSRLKAPAINEKIFVIEEAKLCTVRKITNALLDLPRELVGETNIDIALPFIENNLDKLIYVVAAAIQNDHNELDNALLNFIEKNFKYSHLMEGLRFSLASIGMLSFVDAYVMLKGSAAVVNPDIHD